jgi:hypothetical protein
VKELKIDRNLKILNWAETMKRVRHLIDNTMNIDWSSQSVLKGSSWFGPHWNIQISSHCMVISKSKIVPFQWWYRRQATFSHWFANDRL